MVPICVSEPMGKASPRRIAATPAMKVVLTAPSPGNSQGWDFVVVTDAEKRRALGEGISSVMAPAVENATKNLGGPGALDDVSRRMLVGALNLACMVLVGVALAARTRAGVH